MAEGRKRVAICAMKQERPQLVWLYVHPTHYLVNVRAGLRAEEVAGWACTIAVDDSVG